MNQIWLNEYPAGVPHTLDLDPDESMVDIFDAACQTYQDQPAFSNFGATISFTELDDQSARFAAYLQGLPGLNRGDRIALMMPNLLQYPVALFGVLRAGMVIVNVNPLYTARELEHQLTHSGAKAIVVAANSAATLAKVVGRSDIEHIVLTEIGDLLGFPKRLIVNFAVRYIKRMVPAYELPNAVAFNDVLATDRAGFSPVILTGADLACLQYTGGTTGRAKGAMLTHANIVANVRQINTWFGSRVEKGVELIITALPLYHVYALTCNCLCYLDLGAHNILITDPRDTAGLIDELKKWKFTAITGVNTLYQSLVNHPRLDEVDFSSVNIASAGGMAVMEDTAQQWFERTGTEIIEGYGLTEASPVVTSNPANMRGFSGSIGLPLPGTDISLRNDRGEVVADGESGELCVRGPQVMAGYWQDAEATADTMTSDGFLMTGDIATMDDTGYFRIVDRKKDMIIVSGFNVYPNEVENVVTMHPNVVESACIGVRDDHGEETVKIFVVLQPGTTLSNTELRDFCRDNLAAYKVPRLIEFRDELPKTNVGKILRRALREEATVAT
jgi:long-chain acyl-CoA synthetase